MTDLLVSVRDDCEFRTALAAGVAIIDFKEPSRGALAAVEPAIWRSAVKRLAAPLGDQLDGAPSPRGRSRLSAALGEPHDWRAVIGRLPAGFQFAKIGPSGIETAADLKRLWHEAARHLGPTTELVAVAYADFEAAHCLSPAAIFQLASEAGFQRGLVDTFTKDGRSTLDHLTAAGLRELGQIASRASMQWAIAGSLRLAMVDELETEGVHPDCYAVRGDLCEQDRTGNQCPRRLKQWGDRVALLSGQRSSLFAPRKLRK
ncbi:MAG: (5-formylfuran-3-yl)methyl phosphate synthase [Novipirellula sp. JB048]